MSTTAISPDRLRAYHRRTAAALTARDGTSQNRLRGKAVLVRDDHAKLAELVAWVEAYDRECAPRR